MSVFSREDQTPSQAFGAVVTTSHGGLFKNTEFKPYTFSMRFKCSRDTEHKLHFRFRVDADSIVKFGEYPSRVDRLHPELQRFEKLLGPHFHELRSAMKLQSHGFGIGAFIYLRRVFERVLKDVAVKKYKGKDSWSYDNWRKDKRVKNVNRDLSEEFPDSIVDNKGLYVILSKGVHNLDEEECLAAYPIDKAATEEILDDIILNQQKAQRRKGVTKEIQELQSSLGDGYAYANAGFTCYVSSHKDIIYLVFITISRSILSKRK